MAAQVKDYALSQKILHWLMAILVIVNWAIGQRFVEGMDIAGRASLRTDHATIGSAIAVLLVIRLYLRWKHGPPGFPEDMALWERLIAHCAHWALYAVMAALVITGAWAAVRAQPAIEVFGLIPFASGAGDGAGGVEAFAQIRSIHALSTKALAALFGLHMLAVFYHASIVGNGFITRMFSVSRGTTDDS